MKEQATYEEHLAVARRLLDYERQWIIRCGGDLAGYIANYGSENDPDRNGNGEAIYAADLGSLYKAEQRLADLLELDGPAMVAGLIRIKEDLES